MNIRFSVTAMVPFLAAAALGLLPAAYAGEDPARNIILMVSDGAGYNAFDACSYYQYGKLGEQVYDRFPKKYATTHYMLNDDGQPQGYDPDLMWTDFNYVRGDGDGTAYTDSAAAATAWNTGNKTKGGRINTGINGHWLTAAAEILVHSGKAIGTVTSVEISHATPACVWAHNKSRNNYNQIAKEMIYSSGLDLIMGAGHPLFDDNGEPVSPGTNSYKYVGGQSTWNELVAGTTGQGWTLIEEKADFEALADGTMTAPDRLVGIAQVYKTLQYNRDGTGMGNLNSNVPSLATITRGALEMLSQDPDGFFLQIEGGAVDWANHGNNIERMIEEQIDFNRAVEAVVDWVDANSHWGETLVIVTADHETGMIWGPGTYIDVDTDGEYDPDVDVFVDWMHVENNGVGNIPGVQYGSDGHTNTLVPLYAKGCGASLFNKLVDGSDKGAKRFWGTPGGRYVDNTDIFPVLLRNVIHDQDRAEESGGRPSPHRTSISTGSVSSRSSGS